MFYNIKNNIIKAAHINDLLIFAFNKENINTLKEQIFKKVEIFDLGNVNYYLNINITRNKNKKELYLSQFKYINKLLIKFNIKDDKPVYTPTVQNIRLKKNMK